MQDILIDARDELKSHLEDTWDDVGWQNLEPEDIDGELEAWMNSDIGDIIYEIADNSVPIYHADLLKEALMDLNLDPDEPEILCWDGKSTAVNAIAGNIYEGVVSHLYEEEQDIKEEIVDERLDTIICETKEENKK